MKADVFRIIWAVGSDGRFGPFYYHCRPAHCFSLAVFRRIYQSILLSRKPFLSSSLSIVSESSVVGVSVVLPVCPSVGPWLARHVSFSGLGLPVIFVVLIAVLSVLESLGLQNTTLYIEEERLRSLS